MANRKGHADRGGQGDAPEGPYIWPGSYSHCLRAKCEAAAYDADKVLLARDADELAVVEAERAAQVAAEMDRRRGETVCCQDWQLGPRRDPAAPPWPYVGHRCFYVSPDDVVAPY